MSTKTLPSRARRSKADVQSEFMEQAKTRSSTQS
jgi:hypothetical protein